MSNPQRGPEGEEPVVIRDRRRIDPQSGAVRDEGTGRSPFPGAAGQPAPGDPNQAGQPIGATLADSEELAGLKAELADRTAHLQRLNAEFANYRKRTSPRPRGRGSSGEGVHRGRTARGARRPRAGPQAR